VAMPPSDAEISAALEALAGWERVGDEIVKTFEFASFADAISFVVRVGFLPSPPITIPISTFVAQGGIALTTHSANGLTNPDFDLATESKRSGT